MAAENGWLKRLEMKERGRPGQMAGLHFLVDGSVVSYVDMREKGVFASGCWIGGGSIGGGATDEEYRNRGPATHLMERAIGRIDEDGEDVMFVSGDQGLYRLMGCVGAGILRVVTAGKRDLRAFENSSLNARYAEEYEMIDLVKLYQAEPVRWRGLEAGAAPLWRHLEPH